MRTAAALAATMLAGTALAATPEVTARAQLAAAGVDVSALRTELVVRARNGAAVKLGQTYRGVPVLGGGAVVRVDDAGTVRWSRLTLAALPADLDPTPHISASAALRTAGAVDGLDEAAHARLVILPGVRGGAARLAWQLLLPADLRRLEQIGLLVDAHTGELLARENFVRDAANHQATVYADNPLRTPTPVVVTLADLPAGAVTLSGPDIGGYGCDLAACVLYPDLNREFNVCGEQQAAVPDASGSFAAIVRPAADSDPTDAFAEVQAYYHAVRAYTAFRGFSGDPAFAIAPRPLHVVANYHEVLDLGTNECVGGAPPAGSELSPIDNAMYVPAGAFGGGLPTASTIVLGQGTVVDLAYDGDVVYHEFTHAVQFADTGWSYYLADEHGADDAPGALAEGYADYFSSAITGDPELGEYFASGLTPPLPSLRSLANSKVCPAALTGEGHFDSEIWTGALWDIRETLAPADQLLADQAVYTAFRMVDGGTTLEAAATMTMDELEVVLGPTVRAAAEAAFTARGILGGCAGRVVTVENGAPRDRLFVQSPGWLGSSTSPTVMQFEITPLRDAHAITMRAGRSRGPGGRPFSPPTVSVLVKKGAPIVWTGNAGSADEELAAFVVFDETAVDLPASAEIGGSFPAGEKVYLQLASSGGPDFMLRDVVFDVAYGDGPTDAGPPVDARTSTGGDDEGGCGCSAGGARPSTPVALILVALIRRRRKRPTDG